MVRSPFQLTQEAIVRREVPAKDGMRTRLERIDYHILADGFHIEGISSETVSGFAETGEPATIALRKLSAGDPLSDTAALSGVEYFLEEIVPHVEATHELRARLLDLLTARVKTVPSDGKESEKAAELLRKLEVARPNSE
jgi:hypothetical protein